MRVVSLYGRNSWLPKNRRSSVFHHHNVENICFSASMCVWVSEWLYRALDTRTHNSTIKKTRSLVFDCFFLCMRCCTYPMLVAACFLYVYVIAFRCTSSSWHDTWQHYNILYRYMRSALFFFLSSFHMNKRPTYQPIYYLLFIFIFIASSIFCWQYVFRIKQKQRKKINTILCSDKFIHLRVSEWND